MLITRKNVSHPIYHLLLNERLEYDSKHIEQRDRPVVYNVVPVSPVTIFIDRCDVSQLSATRKIPSIQGSSKTHSKRPREHLSTLLEKQGRNSIRAR